MNTPLEPWKIDAFVDGELSLAEQLALEERLREDPALRRRIDDARALREALRGQADRHAAPSAWRARLLERLETSAEAAAPASVPGPASTAKPARATLAATVTPARSAWWAAQWHRLGSHPFAAGLSAAALIVLGLNLFGLQRAADAHLEDEVIASHVRSTIGEHLLDVASSDHHTVKPYLSARLGFSPPVDELKLPGSVFLGGRVDVLDGHLVAALVYRQGQHLVNAFAWPTHAADSEPRFGEERGFRTAHWSQGGMAHWVVSDVNRTEFEALVRAVKVASVD